MKRFILYFIAVLLFILAVPNTVSAEFATCGDSVNSFDNQCYYPIDLDYYTENIDLYDRQGNITDEEFDPTILFGGVNTIRSSIVEQTVLGEEEFTDSDDIIPTSPYIEYNIFQDAISHGLDYDDEDQYIGLRDSEETATLKLNDTSSFGQTTHNVEFWDQSFGYDWKFNPDSFTITAKIPQDTSIEIQFFEPRESDEDDVDPEEDRIETVELTPDEDNITSTFREYTVPVDFDDGHRMQESTLGYFGGDRAYPIFIQFNKENENADAPKIRYEKDTTDMILHDDLYSGRYFDSMFDTYQTYDDTFSFSEIMTYNFSDEYLSGSYERELNSGDGERIKSSAPQIQKNRFYNSFADDYHFSHYDDKLNRNIIHHGYAEISTVEKSVNIDEDYSKEQDNWQTIVSETGEIHALFDVGVNEIDTTNTNISYYDEEQDANRNYDSISELDNLPPYSSDNYTSEELQTNALRQTYDIENVKIKPVIGVEYTHDNDTYNHNIIDDTDYIKPKSVIQDYNWPTIKENIVNKNGNINSVGSISLNEFYAYIDDVKVEYDINYEQYMYSTETCPEHPGTEVEELAGSYYPVGDAAINYSYSDEHPHIFETYEQYIEEMYDGELSYAIGNESGLSACSSVSVDDDEDDRPEYIADGEWISTDYDNTFDEHLNHNDGSNIVYTNEDLVSGTYKDGNVEYIDEDIIDRTRNNYVVDYVDTEYVNSQKNITDNFSYSTAITERNESYTQFKREEVSDESRWLRGESREYAVRNSVLFEESESVMTTEYLVSPHSTDDYSIKNVSMNIFAFQNIDEDITVNIENEFVTTIDTQQNIDSSSNTYEKIDNIDITDYVTDENVQISFEADDLLENKRVDYTIHTEVDKQTDEISSRWAYNTYRDSSYDMIYNFTSIDCSEDCYNYKNHNYPYYSADETYVMNDSPEDNNPLQIDTQPVSPYVETYLVPSSNPVVNSENISPSYNLSNIPESDKNYSENFIKYESNHVTDIEQYNFEFSNVIDGSTGIIRSDNAISSDNIDEIDSMDDIVAYIPIEEKDDSYSGYMQSPTSGVRIFEPHGGSYPELNVYDAWIDDGHLYVYGDHGYDNDEIEINSNIVLFETDGLSHSRTKYDEIVNIHDVQNLDEFRYYDIIYEDEKIIPHKLSYTIDNTDNLSDYGREISTHNMTLNTDTCSYNTIVNETICNQLPINYASDGIESANTTGQLPSDADYPIDETSKISSFIEYTNFTYSSDVATTGWEFAGDVSWKTQDINNDNIMLFENTNIEVTQIENIDEYIDEELEQSKEYYENSDVSHQISEHDDTMHFDVQLLDTHGEPISLQERIEEIDNVNLAQSEYKKKISSEEDQKMAEGICIQSPERAGTLYEGGEYYDQCFSTDEDGRIIISLQYDDEEIEDSQLSFDIKLNGSEDNWHLYDENTRLLKESEQLNSFTISEDEDSDTPDYSGDLPTNMIFWIFTVFMLLLIVVSYLISMFTVKTPKEIIGNTYDTIKPILVTPIVRMALLLFKYIFLPLFVLTIISQGLFDVNIGLLPLF